MRFIFQVILLFIFIETGCQQSGVDIDANRQWPGYRGLFASGVLDGANLPEIWDIEEMKNIKWKAEIPGLGLSSPVIWGEKVFITTAVSSSSQEGLKTGIFGDVGSVDDNSGHEWKIFCYDKNTGRLIWEKTAHKGIPEIKRHPKSTHANSSVATDGSHVVAFFGSEGLYCYDMNGRLLWEKDFGILRSAFFSSQSAEWEFASSPILFEGIVIIQCDVLENSFLAAFDARTGTELWRNQRDDYPGWATPNIYFYEGQPRIVVNGFQHMGGYDFKTGEEIWRLSGGGDIPIPTPVVGDDLIYLNSAHGRQSPVIAVRKNASGDITLKDNETFNKFVAWSLPRAGAYIQTMICYQGCLYNCHWNGNIFCYNAQTGEEIYRNKLGDVRSFTASPVISDGRLYISDDEGTVYIVQTGNTFRLLNTLSIGDVCMTSPAIADGMMVFRTQHYLIAVGEKP
ncbi:MAG: PQQ-binding-like beta-propeller repeat protein [Bacteroidales bacterium]|nr:PQQ-binding-like beta-propeller repeat protein [Bacteroidales bacterium]